MKECPQCHKGYDDHLSHCQADGTALISRGSTVGDGSAAEPEGAPDQGEQADPPVDSPEAEFNEQKTPTSFLDDYGNDDKTPVVRIGELLNQQQSNGGASRELMSYLESAAGVKEAKSAKPVAGASAQGAKSAKPVAGASAQGAKPSKPVAGASAQGAKPSKPVAGVSASGEIPSKPVAGVSASGEIPSKPVAGVSVSGEIPSKPVAGVSASGEIPSKPVADVSAPGEAVAEDLEVEDLEMEEILPPPPAPPPPPPEQGSGDSSPPDFVAPKPVASGEIDVSSVRLAIASPPEAPGAPGAESPEEQHRSEADGGSPAEGANLTSPLPDDGGNLHDALAPPVDHRRWIMMGVGLALVLGIISLYFLSTSKRQATPATQRTPAKAAPAPVGSSGTEAAVESSGGSDAAGTAVTSAEEGAPSVDAGGRGVESSEDSGAPAAAVKNQPEDTDLLPGINKVPPRAKTPRKRGASPRPRKKLYRKTIDPFAE